MLSRLLRRRASAWALPIARRLPVSANVLTLLAFAAAAGGTALFAVGRFSLAGAAVAASGLLDMLDGAKARDTGDAQRRFGAFLDSAADRLADNLIFFGIFGYFASAATLDVASALLVFAAAAASNVASYYKARMEMEGVACEAGLFGRQERLVLIVLGAWLGPAYFRYVLWMLVLMALQSVASRMLFAYRRL
jgi:CDP-diacylglycerol---glycerol-3-phosphate 3-phosphatidyltransferase